MRVPVHPSLFPALLLSCADLRADSQNYHLPASTVPPVDKSQFTLFNPTPRPLLRDLSTDRPDKTESAYTVDAGHFQVEMDILSYSYDRYNPSHANVSAEAVSIASMNLKLGLLHNWDLQLIVPAYNSTRVHDRRTGAVETRRGFGDLLVRSKLNLWGNDEGATALAVMPVLKVPTAQDALGNGSVEGGILFPFAAELPMGWGLGMTSGMDLARDSSGGGYHPEFINTITFGHSIAGPLSGYIEFYGLVSTERGSDWVGTGDVGLTWLLTEDVQLDLGVNIGITRSADDINPFVGLSMRF